MNSSSFVGVGSESHTFTLLIIRRVVKSKELTCIPPDNQAFTTLESVLPVNLSEYIRTRGRHQGPHCECVRYRRDATIIYTRSSSVCSTSSAVPASSRLQPLLVF